MATFFSHFSGLDLLAALAVAFLVIRGFICGCSGETGRLAGVLAAAATGYFGFAAVARMVAAARLFDANPYAGRLIAFLLLLVVCIAIWLGVSRLLAEGIRLVLPQPFDAIVGGVIGGIKAFVLVAVLCTMGLLSPRESDRNHFVNHSLTAQKIAPLLTRITTPDQ